MQIYDVYTKKVFEKAGVQKTKIFKVGAVKISDRGNMYLRLFHIPDVDFYIRGRETKIPVVQID